MAQVDRRYFLTVAGAAVCAGVAGCTGASHETWSGPTRFELGPAEDFLSSSRAAIDARWAKTGGFFLVREQNRLMAVSAICTHRECPLTPGSSGLVCDCHGSRFTAKGAVLTGPATRSLVHFGISRTPSGQVVVDRTLQFDEPRWNDSGAFLQL